MRPLLWLLWFLGAGSAWAAPAVVPALDQVAQELDGIADDLARAQAQTLALQTRLAGLEALAAEHQKTVEAQADLQARYAQAVADLEAHDRASLALAEDLNRRLEAERRVTGWLWPAAGVLLAAVLVEGWVLVVR